MSENLDNLERDEEARAETGQEERVSSASEAPPTPASDPASTVPHRSRKPRSRPPSIFWPLMLLGAGVMLLLANLGILPRLSWGALWRFWPLLLIVLGVDVLIGRRSTAGAIISAVLVLVLLAAIVAVGWFADEIPMLGDLLRLPTLAAEHVQFPLEGLDSAFIKIDTSGLPCEVTALSDSPNLIEGTVTHRGRLFFDASVHGSQATIHLDPQVAGFQWWADDSGSGTQARCRVALSPEVPLRLELDGGSGPGAFHLSQLQISELALDCGSGPIDLDLPSRGTQKVTIDGGSGPVNIYLPESIAAKVILDSGSGPFLANERFSLAEGKSRGDGIWETPGYRDADEAVLLEIDQGSGPISIR